jgi:hypothetical protein
MYTCGPGASRRAVRYASSTVTGGKIVCLRLRFCGLDGEVADDRQPDEHRELRLDLVPFDSLLMDGQYPCMQIVYQA